MKQVLAFAVVLFITFDPQSLVGEWWGDWITINGQFSGKIYITVKKVDGNKVFGVAEATNTPELRYEKFEGTLDGNVLSISLSGLSMRLEINGKVMRGKGSGTREADITLMLR